MKTCAEPIECSMSPGGTGSTETVDAETELERLRREEAQKLQELENLEAAHIQGYPYEKFLPKSSRLLLEIKEIRVRIKQMMEDLRERM